MSNVTLSDTAYLRLRALSSPPNARNRPPVTLAALLVMQARDGLLSGTTLRGMGSTQVQITGSFPTPAIAHLRTSGRKLSELAEAAVLDADAPAKLAAWYATPFGERTTLAAGPFHPLPVCLPPAGPSPEDFAYTERTTLSISPATYMRLLSLAAGYTGTTMRPNATLHLLLLLRLLEGTFPYAARGKGSTRLSFGDDRRIPIMPLYRERGLSLSAEASAAILDPGAATAITYWQSLAEADRAALLATLATGGDRDPKATPVHENP